MGYRCSKMRILTSNFNEISYICPNSTKNRNLGRLVRAIAIWEWIKQLLKNSFNLKTRVFFEENDSRISYPRNNEVTAV